MSKEQNTTGSIQPPNKDLEILKQNFPSCFDKNGAFDFEKFKTQLSKNEINFSKESYGMDWLGKSYARLLATDETTTLLKEDEVFNQKEENKNSENLLIKGDNLEVLKHLSNAYYEKVKMIYIDPPYNTGSDGFVYSDDRKFDVPTLMELSGVSEERAKRILDFTQSKSNSHSAWLTFMYPRLYIAKQLLKDDGAIFVSIDDNEVAQLRLLMDEVFGEENFVGNISWESKTKSQNTKDSFNKLQPKIEHILLFTKKDKRRFNLIQKGEKQYLLNDEKGEYRDYVLEVMNADGIRGRDSMVFEIEGISPPQGKQWKLGQEKISEFKNREDLFVRKGKIFLKMRPADEKSELTNPFWGLLNKDIGTAESAKKELSIVLKNNKHGFETVKPVNLIKRLIFHSSNVDDLILDFFAGSGTTADAVLQLNVEVGGKRKFILAQLPELIDPKSNKTAYDFVKNELKVETPTIFDITKERLIRASKKIQEENKDKDLSNQDLGFKVFETMPIWEDYNFESEELEKQTSLFDESKLTTEDIKALLVTWKTYDGVKLTTSIQEIDLNGYTAHYCNEKLYLMDKGFTTENLKALLEKIDSDKSFNPTTIIAFGYHFESKNLREIGENIKSYTNKKSIDIDFITRY
ncbi:site-specific DNA-methyltransferase [Polaribacter sp.]|uniref:site-specific DNA-methyltransferase n=1 Tax=Polaribacter sp. TaxID=1920175 RepID=UPI003F69C08B